MQNTQLYCKACAKPVRVVITEGVHHDGQAEVHDEEVVCLDLGEACAGTCPLGSVEPDAMVGRIIRNGLPTDGLTTIKANCPSCGVTTDMALYGGGRAACTVCGTSARWAVDHAEPRWDEPPKFKA
jgi:ribosomal protein S27AE